MRPRAFPAAMAIGALLRTVPYVLLGQALGSGSPLALALGAASIVLGGAGGGLLVWRLRADARLASAGG